MSGTKKITPVCYLLLVSVVFVLMCIAIGHPTWIFKIFIESSFSDATNDTARMLTTSYVYTLLENFPIGEETQNFQDAVNAVGAVIYANVPTAMLFSIVDSFVMRRTDVDGKQDDTICFFAGYMLQALIALAFTTPVTCMMAINKIMGAVINIVILTVILPVIYCLFISHKNFMGMLNAGVDGVCMSLVFVFAGETGKMLIVSVIFGVITYPLYVAVSWTGIGILMSIFTVVVSLLFVFIYRKIGKPMEELVDKGVAAIRNRRGDMMAAVGEWFWFVACIAVIICGFRLYFKMN